jgi:hypothetical protein
MISIEPSLLQRMKFNTKVRIQRALKEAVMSILDCSIIPFYPAAQAEHVRGFFSRLSPANTDRGLIRLGNRNDGGYLIPDDLAGVRACFSPGVSTMADFELGLSQRGIRCFLADYSVESAPVSNDLISFEKRFLGALDDSVYMTLASWLNRHAEPDDNDLILQMDIEGGEYDVLIGTSIDILRRFRIIVIEFHFLYELFSPAGFKLIDAAFAKLLKSFKIVHIHPNNSTEPLTFRDLVVPPVMEVTFLRSDRISEATPSRVFPHQLDAPCCAWRQDYPVPPCWYRT